MFSRIKPAEDKLQVFEQYIYFVNGVIVEIELQKSNIKVHQITFVAIYIRAYTPKLIVSGHDGKLRPPPLAVSRLYLGSRGNRSRSWLLLQG